MHILGSPISRVKQLIVKLKAEKVLIPNKWNSQWATVLRSKLWTMYNLTHVKVHFSVLQTLSEHLLYPNVPTLQTQPRQVGTQGCLLAAPPSLGEQCSEDPARHDLLLLGEGKESGGYYKLFIKSSLLFTPIPVGLSLYITRSPRKKEMSRSRHWKRDHILQRSTSNSFYNQEEATW